MHIYRKDRRQPESSPSIPSKYSRKTLSHLQDHRELMVHSDLVNGRANIASFGVSRKGMAAPVAEDASNAECNRQHLYSFIKREIESDRLCIDLFANGHILSKRLPLTNGGMAYSKSAIEALSTGGASFLTGVKLSARTAVQMDIPYLSLRRL